MENHEEKWTADKLALVVGTLVQLTRQVTGTPGKSGENLADKIKSCGLFLCYTPRQCIIWLITFYGDDILEGLVAIIIIVVVFVILITWFIGVYNRLVGLRNRVDTQWAQIDVELKRRYDLIPNLVETVKGYASHERETLQKVIEARQVAIDAKTVHEQGVAENMLTGALRSIFALAEAYPDLKANQNFLQLQGELSAIEGVVAAARAAYNESVLQYNNVVQMFPSNVVAGMSGFGLREFFEVTDPEVREVPKVQF